MAVSTDIQDSSQPDRWQGWKTCASHAHEQLVGWPWRCFLSANRRQLDHTLTTGKAYFDCLIVECDKAKTEVCILGWQVNWDALLAPGVRLYDLLLRTAKRGVRIYVMPWDDTNPVQTYDDQTKIVLESINSHPEVNAKGRDAKCCWPNPCHSQQQLLQPPPEAGDH